MENDENDKSLSQEDSQKSQRLPIYSNESKVLTSLGQAQATNEKNNRYVNNFKCSGCINVDCHFIYTFEKFNKTTSKLSTKAKLDVFINTMISYFKDHNDKCKTKENVLKFLQHYRQRYDSLVEFTPIDESIASYFFELTDQKDIFDMIKEDNNKIVCLNILKLDKNNKATILCCNCRFETTANTLLMRTPSSNPSSIAVHNCEIGSQRVTKKRKISGNIAGKAKKQRINIMDILKKKKTKDNDNNVLANNKERDTSTTNEKGSRLQKLSPSDFFSEKRTENLSLGSKNKNAIINNRSVSAGGALSLKRSNNPSAKSRSVSENKFGIDVSLLFDSEEEDVVETKIAKLPAELDLELSSSENNPTKQGDLLGQLDLDLLDVSDIDPEEVHVSDSINANNNEGSTYAPRIKDENGFIQAVKNPQKPIPLSSASLKHVHDVSRITNDSDSFQNNSRYTHREIIQSRVISDIPVDFGKIQDFKKSPQAVKKQQDVTPEPTTKRQISVLENIKSPILNKTRQQLKTTKPASTKKKYIGYSPQSNNIMDSYEEFDDKRNMSLRDASIHSPKRLKKLVLSEDIKNVDENTIRKLSKKDDILPDEEEVGSVESGSPSVVINRQVNESVSFNIQELRPSTPKQADQKEETTIQSDQKIKISSPIRRPIIMESPVHSEIKKFTNTKSSPSKHLVELQKDIIDVNAEASDSELLLSIKRNQSVIHDPKENALLDLKNKSHESSVEILDSFDNHEEVAYTGITLKEISGLGVGELSLYMAKRTLHVNNIQNLVDLSLKNRDMKDFGEVLSTQKTNVLEDEKNFHKSLLHKQYQLQKDLINENHTALMQRVDDCQDLNVLINLYNKLK